MDVAARRTALRHDLPDEPTIHRAFQAGYDSIDLGSTFWHGFERFLRAEGFHRPKGAPCTCPDAGRHGHLPECGWTKREKESEHSGR